MKKLTLLLLALSIAIPGFAQNHKTQNVIVVTLDGFRWQELFRGADSAIINSKFTDTKADVRKKYWATTPEDRRKMLMPFFWSTIVSQGQLYGDRDAGNSDEVANNYHFSYPGYNEIFTGFPDVRVNSNNPVPNPNTSVFEYLNKQRGFENKIAVFASWEAFPAIFNVGRSGLTVNAGYADFDGPKTDRRLEFLNEMQHKAPHYLGDTRIDFMTYELGMEYLKEYKPRVLYIAFDETDDMAHAGNYKMYLSQAHQEDAYLQDLWQYLQSDPQYKDKTTLIVTCDHGRGDASPEAWKSHGTGIKNSEQTWFAVIGPDTPNDGIIKTKTTTYHKQLAQSIAKLLGFDFKKNADHEVGDAIDAMMAKDKPSLGK
ncbi:alkaline phosphatase family protein [Mucilaginibacter ginsenosidivorans]|uniref:Phosphoglyceromutase n=1 Tax=Mucilaginibacter ginsenosidivorans TaxID=398053 RepID=A0A5B8V079_9SPHI|nr:alkaline phosphatase family protein [Mucilaginibacter ginsenosidivorans]QEC64598.1 phosphoglyceromutase [Mucilaginibacter ginsenosidivorans]